MKRNHFLQLIIVCFAVFFSTLAHAGPVDKLIAQKWVEEKGNLLLNTFIEEDLAVKYKKLDELFVEHVDLEYIGQFVVGKYWRKMTPVQQSKYLSLFKRYALGMYKGFPLNFKNKIAFKVNNVSSDTNSTSVWTTIDLGTPEEGGSSALITVAFRLRQQGQKIKIVDITLAESSLTLSYRSKFYQMIMNNDEDIDWFIEDLETMAVSSEKNNQLKLLSSQPNLSK